MTIENLCHGVPDFIPRRAICLHCLKQEGDASPWCKESPGQGCTYGLGHEYPEPLKPKPPGPKKDKKLCLKCGLHPKNPASAANGCAHEYEP